jgi:hypothetical protein
MLPGLRWNLCSRLRACRTIPSWRHSTCASQEDYSLLATVCNRTLATLLCHLVVCRRAPRCPAFLAMLRRPSVQRNGHPAARATPACVCGAPGRRGGPNRITAKRRRSGDGRDHHKEGLKGANFICMCSPSGRTRPTRCAFDRCACLASGLVALVVVADAALDCACAFACILDHCCVLYVDCCSVLVRQRRRRGQRHRPQHHCRRHHGCPPSSSSPRLPAVAIVTTTAAFIGTGAGTKARTVSGRVAKAAAPRAAPPSCTSAWGKQPHHYQRWQRVHPAIGACAVLLARHLLLLLVLL